MERIVRLEDRHYDFFENVLGLGKWIVDNYFNCLSETEQIEYIPYVDGMIEKDNKISTLK